MQRTNSIDLAELYEGLASEIEDNNAAYKLLDSANSENVQDASQLTKKLCLLTIVCRDVSFYESDVLILQGLLKILALSLLNEAKEIFHKADLDQQLFLLTKLNDWSHTSFILDNADLHARFVHARAELVMICNQTAWEGKLDAERVALQHRYLDYVLDNIQLEDTHAWVTSYVAEAIVCHDAQADYLTRRRVMECFCLSSQRLQPLLGKGEMRALINALDAHHAEYVRSQSSWNRLSRHMSNYLAFICDHRYVVSLASMGAAGLAIAAQNLRAAVDAGGLILAGTAAAYKGSRLYQKAHLPMPVTRPIWLEERREDLARAQAAAVLPKKHN